MINPYKPLPTSHVINGVEVGMDMSFDNIMSILDDLNDKTLAPGHRILFALTKLLDELPEFETADEVKDLWVELYNTYIANPEQELSVVTDIKGNPMPSLDGDGERSFDLKQDMSYIFSSFMFDYGLNLVQQQSKLHWHEFTSLLNGLSDECKLRKIIKIRQMEIPPIGKTPEEIKHYHEVIRMKKAVALKESDE